MSYRYLSEQGKYYIFQFHVREKEIYLRNVLLYKEGLDSQRLYKLERGIRRKNFIVKKI